MTLYERMYEDFVLLTPTAAADGEGGQTSVWTAGATFPAVAVFNSSSEKSTGAEAGVSSAYTVTVPCSVSLTYHDIIRRKSDGKIFRVTSDGDDVVTPDMATFSFIEVKAEEWKLPDGGSAGGGA